jgi:hypothetical protein
MLTDEQIKAVLDLASQVEQDGTLALDAICAELKAIESAATAPLLERIAELERKSDQDEATMLWQAGEISKHLDRIAGLERQLEQAKKDADRFQWLCGFSSVTMPELTWGRRAGIPKNKLDAAIDAAIQAEVKP